MSSNESCSHGEHELWRHEQTHPTDAESRGTTVSRVCALRACLRGHNPRVLYPFFGLLLSRIITDAAMMFSSVSVIGNTLRLRNVKF